MGVEDSPGRKVCCGQNRRTTSERGVQGMTLRTQSTGLARLASRGPVVLFELGLAVVCKSRSLGEGTASLAKALA